MSEAHKTNWYVTFGQGQYLGLLKDHFVVIENASYDQAMTVAREAFGTKWFMLYMEKDWRVRDSPFTQCLGRLDANGNRIRT